MISFTLWDIVRNLMLAWRWTVVLALVTFVLGGTLGLVILFMRTSRQAWLRQVARLYIELFQGTPLLMQLFLVFFGIALFGIEVPAWLAAGLALMLWSASYLAEIWRGCVEAIPKGQWEASSVLAMSYFQQMRHIVLPQALRIAIAPTVGFSVQIIKSTAVTSIIGFIELSKAGTVITNATFRPFTVFAIVGVFYFVLCWPLSKYSQSLERKYNAAHRH
ncbi:amino acid ABC transporter permease [Herbaspirillum sp. YR522]|uniref:amino acid ABC transporter permease n=1 Tax=Herbaspirillum sp. YR522 TaxID=1144342 RepID=UPI00026F9980|nr:amino acid ABC transporter permease [Herbaspirillum sp. YR522]EJN08991.1 amine acid ABC transporter, permease protein, 3-TM region, His/Glu/Gln/Arg/opine family [Herbaspirillum sp. YR522]